MDLQHELVRALRVAHPVYRTSDHLSWPRDGIIELRGESWQFLKHGAGIRFSNPKQHRVVDIHDGLPEETVSFDVWRLTQFRPFRDALQRLSHPVAEDIQTRAGNVLQSLLEAGTIRCLHRDRYVLAGDLLNGDQSE